MTGTRIFVYGTLLAGEPNHRYLERGRFVGPGRTAARFTMIDMGAFPGVIARGRAAIVGQVYEVDDVTLGAVDRLEGHPSFYKRTKIALDTGEIVQTYLLPRSRLTQYLVVPDGDWKRRPRCVSGLSTTASSKEPPSRSSRR